MKHASKETIDRLDGLLSRVRLLPGLNEKKPGIFYRKSKAFLHFHEDGDDIFADVRLDGQVFSRHPLTSAREQRIFIDLVAGSIAEGRG